MNSQVNPWNGCVRAFLSLCKNEGLTRAIGKIVIGEMWEDSFTAWITIADVRVIVGKDGKPWLSLPRTRRNDGAYQPTIWIEDADLYAEIQSEGVSEYRLLLDLKDQQLTEMEVGR